MASKGALREILSCCSGAEVDEGRIVPIDEARPKVEQLWQEATEEGMRVLGLAYRDLKRMKTVRRDDETDMIFLGLIVLADPPKPDIPETIQELRRLGVRLKIVTGDSTPAAIHIARVVGLNEKRILSGMEMRLMTDEALLKRASETDIFAEIEPSQKERIVRALKKGGQVVGYIGDGINDASALHSADVSLSVDTAVDVAREAADFVLLDRTLDVLIEGVREGRRTFSNTMKYIFIATSANFGNMFSMAGASLLLPFLPLLPKQILLINLLTDLPEMTIAGDNVDDELVQKPRKWDMRFIRRFMIVFGLISSVFDYLTFGVLILLGATMTEFRTGWFIESIVSACLIVLVVRSRRPFFKSRPSRLLVLATTLVVLATLLIAHLPFANVLGFTTLPPHFYPALAGIAFFYVLTAEIAKWMFYQRYD